ncbi:hypothetical protein F2Q69_00035305 [Brassica cretica]|uniref:Uncharacterized protein n=1 Tax=Brassica cretica TaxID=69181 RepID=A0A8S9SRD8_BRACR|nr:hypothetical protein F2Q69_00035305 [Brassica cretica]
MASFSFHGFDARCTHLAPSWSLRFSKVVDGMLGPERVRYLAARGRFGTERVSYLALLHSGFATSLRDVAMASFSFHGFDARCTHLAPSWSLRFSKVVDGMLGPERVRYLAARGRFGTERVSYLALVGRSTLQSF